MKQVKNSEPKKKGRPPKNKKVIEDLSKTEAVIEECTVVEEVAETSIEETPVVDKNTEVVIEEASKVEVKEVIVDTKSMDIEVSKYSIPSKRQLEILKIYSDLPEVYFGVKNSTIDPKTFNPKRDAGAILTKNPFYKK